MLRYILTFALVAIVVALGPSGCEDDESAQVDADRQRLESPNDSTSSPRRSTGEVRWSVGSPVSPRSRWRASGQGLRNPGLAVDGHRSTAAVAEGNYTGAGLTIDLGKVCVLNLVRLEHPGNGLSYSGRVALLTSLDGEQFEPQMEVYGTRGSTTLCNITPILARYIRLQAVRTGDRPWAIAEVHIQ